MVERLHTARGLPDQYPIARRKCQKLARPSGAAAKPG